MIPDYLVTAYQELQHEKGRTTLSFEEAQGELAELTDLYLTLAEIESAHGESEFTIDD